MELTSTLTPAPCSVYRRLQIGSLNSSFRNAIGTSSVLEALRDALYKSTTITTTTTTTNWCPPQFTAFSFKNSRPILQGPSYTIYQYIVLQKYSVLQRVNISGVGVNHFSHPLPTDVWLALELNSKLFEAFFSFSKTIRGLFECSKIQGCIKASIELKPARKNPGRVHWSCPNKQKSNFAI